MEPTRYINKDDIHTELTNERHSERKTDRTKETN